MRLIKYDGKVRITQERGPTGELRGAHVEHKDGRVDGVAYAEPVNARVRKRRER